MRIFLPLILLTARLISAAPGEVYITPDNTGTNAFPASVGTNLVVIIIGTSPDGQPFATVDGVLAHTTGSIFEVNNGGDHYFTVDANGVLAFGIAGTNNGTITTDTNGTIQATSGATGENAGLEVTGTSHYFIRTTDGINTPFNVYFDGSVDILGRAPGGQIPEVFIQKDTDGTTFSEYMAVGITMNFPSGELVHMFPDDTDGQTPYLFATSLEHTSGNLMEVHNGTLVEALTADNFFLLRGANSGAFTANFDGHSGYLDFVADFGTGFRLDPSIVNGGGTAYVFNTRDSITNTLFSIQNAGFEQESTSATGVKMNLGGFASSATDAATTIASTGWTNTIGKNAIVYLDGAALVFTVHNAGSPVYTNSAAVSNATVLLQPTGKVVITGGALGVGRAVPF